MKALLNWRYYVLMVVGMIAVIGTFSVPIDDQPLGAWLLALIIPKIIGFGLGISSFGCATIGTLAG